MKEGRSVGLCEGGGKDRSGKSMTTQRRWHSAGSNRQLLLLLSNTFLGHSTSEGWRIRVGDVRHVGEVGRGKVFAGGLVRDSFYTVTLLRSSLI